MYITASRCHKSNISCIVLDFPCLALILEVEEITMHLMGLPKKSSTIGIIWRCRYKSNNNNNRLKIQCYKWYSAEIFQSILLFLPFVFNFILHVIGWNQFIASKNQIKKRQTISNLTCSSISCASSVVDIITPTGKWT